MISCTDVIPSDNTLTIVHILFRHGFRNPTLTYENDPHKNHSWLGGLGALTNKGKIQMYELGTNLRKRYQKFFEKENFQTNLIYIRSSDFERTMMSASVFMTGFYPPTKQTKWHPDLDWTPAAIHVIDRKFDNLMFQVVRCPLYNKEKKRYTNTEQELKIDKKYSNLYRDLTKLTGQNISNDKDVFFFYITLKVQEQHGLKIPNWLNYNYPKPIESIAIRAIELNTGTNVLKRLKAGFLIKDIIDNTKAKERNELNPDRDIFVYSAHDSTIINLLNALGVFDHELPDYGATVTVEGHVTSVGKTELRLFYFKNYGVKNPIELHLPGCHSPCLMDEFLMTYDNIIPKRSMERECAVDEETMGQEEDKYMLMNKNVLI